MTTQEYITSELRKHVQTTPGLRKLAIIEDRKYANEGTWRLYDDDLELFGEIGFSFGHDSFSLVFGDDLRSIRKGSVYTAMHLRAAVTAIYDFLTAEA